MTGSDDNHQTADFRPDGFVQRSFRSPKSGAYRLVVWAFVLGSASHLWLADAWQPEWFPADIVYALGLVVLLISGGAAGWWLSAIGLAIPLFFLRDQLTQSMFMLAVSVAGGVLIHRDAGTPPTDSNRVGHFLATCRWLTVVTYGFAAFHKLNHDFFDPSVGCATYGLRELADYYRLDPEFFSFLEGLHAPFAVGLELAIPLAYVLGRRHVARILALVFHIPLTMTMAPAFAFVMSIGHAAWMTDEERSALWRVARASPGLVIVPAVVLTTASLVAHGAMPEPTMIPREFLLWLGLVWCLVALGDEDFRSVLGPSAERWRPGQFGGVIIALFVLNCVTPYLGVQYQHAAAMLSNLRIDRGCWNHWVVPERVRLTDEYVRVDEVWFGEPGRSEEYEEIVLEQLWSPPQIRQMRRNWCRPEMRPFHMKGSYRGREWAIADLCDPEEPWPFEDAGIFGVELFGDYLRFQKNLMRECPQSCIH